MFIFNLNKDTRFDYGAYEITLVLFNGPHFTKCNFIIYFTYIKAFIFKLNKNISLRCD